MTGATVCVTGAEPTSRSTAQCPQVGLKGLDAVIETCEEPQAVARSFM